MGLSEFDDIVLEKDLEVDVGAIHFVQRGAHLFFGQVRRVAGTREVRERELGETGGREAAHEIGRLIVREVSARTIDALDDRRRASRVVQHDGIVIRLERRQIGFGELNADRVQRRADVGGVEVGEAVTRGLRLRRFAWLFGRDAPRYGDEVADGVARVVGNREGLDGERAKIKGLSVLKADERLFVELAVVAHRLGRHRIGEDRHIGMMLEENLESLHVVDVGVGEEDAGKTRQECRVPEAGGQGLVIETAVDEKRIVARLNEIRIPLRSASK